MAAIALMQGLLAASSLLLGSLLGIFWQPRRSISAAIMAFGSGTLISAIAFEIALPVYQEGSVWPLPFGFLLGGGAFALATQYIDRQGGFLRHPSTRRRFLFRQRQQEAVSVLSALANITALQNIPPDEAQAIVSAVERMDIPAGEVLFEAGMWGIGWG